MIQLNYILIYLHANLTTQKSVIKLARVRRKKQQQNTYKQNTKQGVGDEVFTAVVLKSIIFWDMTPCNP
jgi:hypothetical protein